MTEFRGFLMYQMEIGLSTPVVEYLGVIGSILALLHRRTVVVVVHLMHRRTVVVVVQSMCQPLVVSPRSLRSMLQGTFLMLVRWKLELAHEIFHGGVYVMSRSRGVTECLEAPVLKAVAGWHQGARVEREGRDRFLASWEAATYVGVLVTNFMD